MEHTYPKTIPEALQGVVNMCTERNTTATIWQLSVVSLMVSLGFVLFMLVTEGHAAFNTSSDGVNWGSAIATYVFFALTSSGLTIIAALATVFGFKEFYPIAKRCIWLAIVTLIAGFSVLALELGHPFRMIWAMPTGLQVMSPMFWMGVFYSIDLVLLFIKFYLMWKEDWDSGLSHFVGIAGFVAVILASGMLGLVFASMGMRPMWFGSATSVFFILSAALSGAAALVVMVQIAYGFKLNAMPPALKALAWRGRYLVIGFAQGQIPALPWNLLLLKEAALLGVWWGEFAKREPRANAALLAGLLPLCASGAVRPVVDSVLPMTELPAAFARMTARAVVGKLVLAN